MTTIYLIRHAEAEGNLYRRMHGQFDSMITPRGMRQIRALAARFASIPVDLCYASDLLRTRTTAQAIYVPQGLELHPDPAFRELDVGEWDDLPFGYLYTHTPDSMETFGRDPRHWNVQGSEPFAAYTGRFISAMTDLSEENPGKTIAIFSHAAVTRGVIMSLFPEETITPCDNTGVTKLTYENGSYRLIYLNDGSHLTPELSTLASNRTSGGGMSKRDSQFWFRPGYTVIEGLEGPETSLSLTVLAGEMPVGLICMNEQDPDTAVLEYMGLLPPWRGRGRAVQLLGEAIYTLRRQGKKYLVFRKPENGALDDLCRRMELEADRDGLCRIAVQPWLRPL